eukprot:m.8231 g.8231  ORF g.8231 m.8231 type:complete len:695 (-) comp3858_c0_seq1:58-2142(-)
MAGKEAASPPKRRPQGAAAKKAARKSMGQPTGGLEHHQSSQNGAQTFKKGVKKVGKAGKKAGRKVSKWFGLMDQHEFDAMQKGYCRKKVDETMGPAHRNAPYGANAAKRKPGPRTTEATYSSSSDSDSDNDLVDNLPEERNKKYTRNLQVGLARYRQVRLEERTKQLKPGWFGGKVNKKRHSVIEAGFSRTMAEAPKRKHSNIRDQTLVALQLEAMPTYYPWFTYGITNIQLIIMLCVLAHAFTSKSFASVGLVNKSQKCSSDCPDNFIGVDENFEVLEEVNWTIGPTTKYLLALGAKYAACMRDEDSYSLQAARVRSDECIVDSDDNVQPGYNCEGADSGEENRGYACCTSYKTGRLGMMSFDDCKDNFAKALVEAEERGEVVTETIDDFPGNTTKYWVEGTDCEQEGFPVSNIVLRPCCGIRMNQTTNNCELLTQRQCELREGAWQEDKILCADTMCLTEICNVMSELRIGRSFEVSADSEIRNTPVSPNQWWRFITPLFLHSGVIHAILILIVQYYCGKSIETASGFLRIFLIYFISGIGGNVISAIFSPTTVSMGADPAVYGLMGVMFVELFQAWQVVPNPWSQLIKLSLIVAFSLLIGTFPYVDNWSHVGGFAFGVVSGIVFLPYITFGKWDARRKQILLAICVPLLLLMMLAAQITFYRIQNSNFCSWCPYLNCIEYSDEIDCQALQG